MSAMRIAAQRTELSASGKASMMRMRSLRRRKWTWATVSARPEYLRSSNLQRMTSDPQICPRRSTCVRCMTTPRWITYRQPPGASSPAMSTYNTAEGGSEP